MKASIAGEPESRAHDHAARKSAATPAPCRLPSGDRPVERIAVGPDYRRATQRHHLAVQLSGAAPRCPAPVGERDPLLRPPLCQWPPVVPRAFPIQLPAASRRADARCIALLFGASTGAATGCAALTAGQVDRIAPESDRPGPFTVPTRGPGWPGITVPRRGDRKRTRAAGGGGGANPHRSILL